MVRNYFFLALFPFISGCATIIHGTTQIIPVNTSPAGATLIVDQNMEYATPCNIELKRNISHTFRFKKEGFRETLLYIRPTISYVTAGNFFIGGVGLAVDAVTGAIHHLSPDIVNITLARDNIWVAKN